MILRLILNTNANKNTQKIQRKTTVLILRLNLNYNIPHFPVFVNRKFFTGSGPFYALLNSSMADFILI